MAEVEQVGLAEAGEVVGGGCESRIVGEELVGREEKRAVDVVVVG